jgi:hypothetical protein
MIKETIKVDTEIEKRDRNRMISIDCSLSTKGDYVITVTREVVHVQNEQEVKLPGLETKIYTVTRKLSEIIGKKVTLPAKYGSLSFTGAQIGLALEALTDLCAAEDQNKK